MAKRKHKHSEICQRRSEMLVRLLFAIGETWVAEDAPPDEHAQVWDKFWRTTRKAGRSLSPTDQEKLNALLRQRDGRGV